MVVGREGGKGGVVLVGVIGTMRTFEVASSGSLYVG